MPRPKEAAKWGGIMCREGEFEDSLEDRSSVLPILDLLERQQGRHHVHPP